MESRELKVPVPWGHIAIKAWGSPDNEAVIVLHGLIDNAGSFDALVPLLPSSFYYLCVDLPGHGFSSHFPPNLPLHYLNYMYSVRSVADHFQREKYVIFAHSFGARVALLYTQLHPQSVSKIAILDSGYTTANPPEDHMESLMNAYDLLKKMAAFDPERQPTYSYEEIVKRIMESRFNGFLTFETAEDLARRMIKRVGEDRYQLTYDQRLRQIIYPSYTLEYIKDIFKKYPIRCPAISIYASESKRLFGLKRGNRFFNLPNFEMVEIKGHHHSHHTNPELFVPILTKFLLKQNNKL